MYYKRLVIFGYGNDTAIHVDEGYGKKRNRKTVRVPGTAFLVECQEKLGLASFQCIGLFCEEPPCVVVMFGNQHEVRKPDKAIFDYLVAKAEELAAIRR